MFVVKTFGQTGRQSDLQLGNVESNNRWILERDGNTATKTC